MIAAQIAGDLERQDRLVQVDATVEQLVDPVFPRPADVLPEERRQHARLDGLGDFLVERVHFLEMTKDGPQAHAGELGDFGRAGRHRSLADELLHRIDDACPARAAPPPPSVDLFVTLRERRARSCSAIVVHMDSPHRSALSPLRARTGTPTARPAPRYSSRDRRRPARCSRAASTCVGIVCLSVP